MDLADQSDNDFAYVIVALPEEHKVIRFDGLRKTRPKPFPPEPESVPGAVFGTGVSGFSGDGGDATAAQLSSPSSIAAAPSVSDPIWIADTGNLRIRKVTVTINPSTGEKINIITTVLGDGEPVETEDIATDGENVYFAEKVPVAIRGGDKLAVFIKRLDPDGKVTPVAGNGQIDGAGDGGPALSASLTGVVSLSFVQGSLFVVDGGPGDVSLAGTRIRRITFVAIPFEASATTNAEGLALSPTIRLPDEIESSFSATVPGSAIDPVTFTLDAVDSAPGAPAITAQAGELSVSTTTPEISGTGPIGSQVTVTVDGVPVGSVGVDPTDGSWTLISSAVPVGSHTLVAYATSLLPVEVSSSASSPVTITVSPVPLPPPGILTLSEKTNDKTPQISGTLDGPDPGIILVFANGERVGEVASSIGGT